MIQLRDLLAEITLGSIAPYATQFVWSTYQVMGQTYYDSEFDADGRRIEMTMTPIDPQQEAAEYIFVFKTPDKWGTTSYSHSASSAVGQLDYLRLIRTVGEAILDFCTQYAPDSIDISGDDGDSAMRSKKTRIYAAFLQHNASRLAQAGYTFLRRGNSLWIVRKQAYDATGIDTPDNPDM